MNTRSEGTKYEEQAAALLKDNGLFIVARNFRCKIGEIDLIARDKGTLVFVEVKYRKNLNCGSPLEAADFRKRQKICKVADYYRMKYQIGENTSIRFDVIGICGEQVEWVKNAFEYSLFPGSYSRF